MNRKCIKVKKYFNSHAYATKKIEKKHFFFPDMKSQRKIYFFFNLRTTNLIKKYS